MSILLDILDEGFAWLEKLFLVLALTVMCLVIFLDFFLREFFNYGFVWAKELAAFLMIWVGFIGASLATRANKHLVVGIPEKLFPPRLIPYVSLGVAILVVILTLFVAYLGWQYVMETRQFEDRSTVLGLPLWIVQIIIPVSLFVVSMRFIGVGIMVMKGKMRAIGGGDVPLPVGPIEPRPGGEDSPYQITLPYIEVEPPPVTYIEVEPPPVTFIEVEPPPGGKSISPPPPMKRRRGK